MAVIHADLSIDRAQCARPSNALSTVGLITTTFARLTDLFGCPDYGPDNPADSTIWLLDTPAGRVHLLHPRATADIQHQVGRPFDWDIQATTASALPWLYKAISGSTARFPDGATRIKPAATLTTCVTAYVDYLYYRRPSMSTRSMTTEAGMVAAQLDYLILQLQHAVHDWEWSRATPAQRRDWATSHRSRSDTGMSDVDEWRAQERWLYGAVGRRPTNERADLATVLRNLADDHAAARDLVRKQHNGFDLDLLDEHVATLRTLATTDAAQ